VELFLLFVMAFCRKLQLASSSPSSSYSLATEDGFLVSFVFLFSSFLNEVTEDGFCLPRLPPVHVLARYSAAWQFNVVPDRGRIRGPGQRAVPEDGGACILLS
jgi:hypothetical protein